MKPSWDEAPEWAEYLVMNSNGLWYWHQKAPRLDARRNCESAGMWAEVTKDWTEGWKQQRNGQKKKNGVAAHRKMRPLWMYSELQK